MACFARAFDDPADQPQPADRLNPPPHAANDNAVLVPRRAGTAACDLLGRITRRAEAGLNATWTYATAATTTYQSLSGKVATIAYPSGLVIQYAYNAYGYLYQMQNRGSGVVSWTVNARDQYLHAVSETAGNGVVTTHTYNARTGRVSGIQAGASNAVANFAYGFDMVGNLLSRQDHDLSTTDQFTYDPLNRLSTYSIAGGAYQTIGYDDLGDIKTKPGVGTYHYPAAGGERPHAVSSITGTVRGVTNPTFTYDGDGNQLSGPGVAVGYTAYDMPAWVSAEQGGATWGSFDWGSGQWNFTGETFDYDSEHQRVEMTAAAGSTFYFNDPTSGAMAEYYVPATGAAQWRDYVIADGHMVAEQVSTVGGSAAMQYFVADHLGSIAVVTDPSGNVVQRMVYDPWGVQLATDGSQLCGAGPTTRGYTGEEQLPTACLINLNARVYDPILGRFMSGDPVTGNVYDMQSLNRYGYVLNNPLSMTDTNGQCPFCLFLIDAFISVFTVEVLKPIFEHVPVLGDLFVIASGIACFPEGLSAECAAEAAGSIAGVESGSVGKGLEAFALTFAESKAFKFVGDDLQGLKALNSADLISDVRYYSTAFVEHGLVGGTFSALQGGGFGSGFLAAGVSELASPYVSQHDLPLGTAESAVVGGTTSVLGGGKFGDGAITGAFGYVDNFCAHHVCWASQADLAAYRSGGPYAFYQSMCSGGDPFACVARWIVAGAPVNPWGVTGQTWLENAYQNAHATEWTTTVDGLTFAIDGEMTQQTLQLYSIQLADAYIRYLGNSELTGRWPSWLAIDQLHWGVNASFGLPPEAYGGTPLGTIAPNLMKNIVCPKCGP